MNPTLAARWRAPVAFAALAYVALGGAALAGWLVQTRRADPPLLAAVCALPLLLCAVLAWRHEPEDRQYVVKLLAATGFGPLLLGFWASAQDPVDGSVAWPLLLPAALLHGVVFVAAVVWLGRFVTRVAPCAGSAAVDAATLQRRLAGLPDAGLPCVLDSGGGAGTLVFLPRPPGAGRTHRVTLRPDAALQQVLVQERLGLAGAQPLDADEASLRPLGGPHFDPARPSAQRLAGIRWQTTMIDPQRLAEWQPRAAADALPVHRPTLAALDPEGVLTVMCALVTRAGWAWQPGWKG